MSLTDSQLRTLASRMGFKLEHIVFKSQLENIDLEYNTPYVINLENEYSEEGKPNSGTHYTALQVNKNSKGKIEPCNMDSCGVGCP